MALISLCMRLYYCDKYIHNLRIFLINGNSVWLLLIAQKVPQVIKRGKERGIQRGWGISLSPSGVRFEGKSCKSRNN